MHATLRERSKSKAVHSSVAAGLRRCGYMAWVRGYRARVLLSGWWPVHPRCVGLRPEPRDGSRSSTTVVCNTARTPPCTHARIAFFATAKLALQPAPTANSRTIAIGRRTVRRSTELCGTADLTPSLHCAVGIHSRQATSPSHRRHHHRVTAQHARERAAYSVRLSTSLQTVCAVCAARSGSQRLENLVCCAVGGLVDMKEDGLTPPPNGGQYDELHQQPDPPPCIWPHFPSRAASRPLLHSTVSVSVSFPLSMSARPFALSSHPSGSLSRGQCNCSADPC